MNPRSATTSHPFTRAAVAEWVGLHYRKNFDAESLEAKQVWTARFLDNHYEEGPLYGAVACFEGGFTALVHPDAAHLLRELADVLNAGQDDFVIGRLTTSAEAFLEAARDYHAGEEPCGNAAVVLALHLDCGEPGVPPWSCSPALVASFGD